MSRRLLRPEPREQGIKRQGSFGIHNRERGILEPILQKSHQGNRDKQGTHFIDHSPNAQLILSKQKQLHYGQAVGVQGTEGDLCLTGGANRVFYYKHLLAVCKVHVM